jgi:hypothetical protein
VGGRIFLVTYTAHTNEFSYGLVAANQIFSSFQITKPSPSETNLTGGKANGFLLYKNSRLGVALEYPIEWLVEDFKFNKPFQLEFWSPSETNPDIYEQRLALEIKSVSSNTILDEYISMYMNKLMKKLSSSFSFIPLESVTMMIDNTPARKIIFKTTSIIGQDIRTLEIFCIKDDKLYNFTFGDELSKFVQYTPIIQKILDSFKFDNFS